MIHKETYRDKFYYNKGKKFYWIGFDEESVDNEKGKIKKYFYLWKGEFLKVITSENDFESENISRFKFVYINNESEEDTLYQKAIQ